MAFKRQDNPRELELTSLIDIVFLLLIFFLVSFAFSLGGDLSHSASFPDLDLPAAASQSPLIGEDQLQHLMIQVMTDTANGSTFRTVYIVWPAASDTLPLTRTQAFEITLRDSTFARLPGNFMKLPRAEFAQTEACSMITAAIARYLAARKSQFGRRTTTVEVRADQNMEFRILDFVMAQCSRYDDDIPQIIIRTRPPLREREYGIQKAAS